MPAFVGPRRGLLGGGAESSLLTSLVAYWKLEEAPTVANGSGTITQATNTITGVGTAFLTEVAVGNLLTGSGISGIVTAIANDASLTVLSSATVGVGVAYTITKGVTRTDATGRGNNLSDNNTVGKVAGKIDFGAQFVATSIQSLSRLDNADLSMGDMDFEIACWVYLDTKVIGGLVSKRISGTASTIEYEVWYDQSGDRFSFFVDDGTNLGQVTANVFGAPSLATWYYVRAWHNSVGNTINISVNNGTADSLAWTTGVQNAAATLWVGQAFSGGGPFNGRLDEIGIWKRLLTTDERSRLYNGGAGLSYPFIGT